MLCYNTLTRYIFSFSVFSNAQQTFDLTVIPSESFPLLQTRKLFPPLQDATAMSSFFQHGYYLEFFSSVNFTISMSSYCGFLKTNLTGLSTTFSEHTQIHFRILTPILVHMCDLFLGGFSAASACYVLPPPSSHVSSVPGRSLWPS